MKGWTPGAVYLCGLGYSTAIVILIGTWLVQTRAEWPTIRGTEPILSSWPNPTQPTEPRAVKAAPRLARESSGIGGEASMTHAQGERPEPGLAASPGGRAGAYRRFARVAAHLCGVDEPILFEMISRESEWRQVGADGRTLRSRSGALGLTQIKASTARDVSPSLDPHDAAQNLIAGACYLRQQFDRFGSWRKALHAYHAGPWRRTTTRATLAYASDIITKGSAQ